MAEVEELKSADVQALVRHGRAAKQADREQQEQLAQQKVDRKGRSSTAADVTAREAELAAVLPAVIDDLEESGQKEQAAFLARVSFARYRIRVRSTPVASSDLTGGEVKRVERVEKTDLATRADGLAAFCSALRKKGREPILAELAERGIDEAWVASLEGDAGAVAEQGRNVTQPSEATAREREAVLAQRKKWSAVHRLVKRAVKGDSALEKLYAAS